MTAAWSFLLTCAAVAVVAVVGLIVLAAAAVAVLWIIAGVRGYLADRRRERQLAAEWRADHPAQAPRDRHGRWAGQ